MKGKLIVIDGVDASGKETQTKKLFEYLQGKNTNVTKIEFPNYNEASSALIKMYLAGEFGLDANSVNPYAASCFYAVDRFSSYKKHWQSLYNNGQIILADRYVTSNAIHQAVKFNDEEKDSYLDWLEDFEYNKLALPKPDLVIFLDMPPAFAISLLSNRYKGDQSKKDIHERDNNYLQKCYGTAIYACEKLGWCRIECVENGKIKSIEQIHKEIINEVGATLYGRP